MQRTGLWAVYISMLAVATSLVLAPSALSAPAAVVPESISPGASLTISVTGMAPNSRARIQVIPKANEGGNCCGFAPSEEVPIEAGGSGTASFVWPATYKRCAGPTDCSDVPWQNGERAVITVYVPGADGLARAETSVALTPSLLIADEPVADPVAQRFRPVWLFDSSEPWRPLNIPAFFESDRPLACAPGGGCVAASSPSQLSAAGGRLDIPGRVGDRTTYRSAAPGCAGALADCDAGPSSGAYVNRSRFGAYTYLDYWVYYRFNSAPAAPFFDHESDWEGVTIAYPTRDPDPQTFDFAAFAAHEGTWRYLRDVLVCGVPASGPCQRVNAYVANGTHATYPQPCSLRLPNLCWQTGTHLIEKGFDGARPWGANDDPSVLKAFPDPASSPWVNWPGNWSSERGNVHSPGRQGRFTAPHASQCTSRFAARPALCAFAAQRPEAGCESWGGPHVAAVACSPSGLRAALAAGSVGQTGTLQLATPEARSATSPAVAQAVGRPLAPGESVAVSGSAAPDTQLTVTVARGSMKHIATFQDLGLESGGAASVAVAANLGVRFTRPDGRVLRPKQISRLSGRTPRAPRRLSAQRRSRTVTVRFVGRSRRTIVELRRSRGGAVVARRSVATRGGRPARVRIRDTRARFVSAVSLGDAGNSSRTRTVRIRR